MRILGVDPSTTRVGMAMYDTDLGTFVWSDSLKVPRPPKQIGQDGTVREVPDWKLLWIYERLSEWIRPGLAGPHRVAIEQQYSAGNRADWVLHVLAFLVRHRCRQAGLSFLEIPRPTSYSLVLGKGSGRAQKSEMFSYMEKTHPHVGWECEDETDAAAVALSAYLRERNGNGEDGARPADAVRRNARKGPPAGGAVVPRSRRGRPASEDPAPGAAPAQAGGAGPQVPDADGTRVPRPAGSRRRRR